MHLAPTYEQALDEVRFGFSQIEDYRGRIHPQAKGPDYYDFEKTVELFNESGAAVIGTPEMARSQIRRLLDKSGGFGTYLLMGVDWANHDDTLRSHRLFAQEVMPHFDGTLAPMTRSYEDAMATGFEGADITAQAQKLSAERYASRSRA